MDHKSIIPETKHRALIKDEIEQERQIHLKNAKPEKQNIIKSPNIASHHPQTQELTTNIETYLI